MSDLLTRLIILFIQSNDFFKMEAQQMVDKLRPRSLDHKLPPLLIDKDVFLCPLPFLFEALCRPSLLSQVHPLSSSKCSNWGSQYIATRSSLQSDRSGKTAERVGVQNWVDKVRKWRMRPR
jgi:hypothetical protein